MIVVPILLYHSVAAAGRGDDDPWQVRAADFAADMDAVAATGRQPMTASGLADWLRRPDREGRPVLVTFDDGFGDYADVARPVLAERGIPATVFVTTGWLDRPRMLARSVLPSLVDEGSVEIGAHSVSHPHLDTLGAERAGYEIRASREALEDVLGRPVRAFAYPHGSHRDTTRRLVHAAGFTTAHAVKNALSHDADDVLALGRYTVRSATSRTEVRRFLTGAGAPLAWRRERLRTSAFRVVRTCRRIAAELGPGPCAGGA
jgi:peptidoglycan/xylan/chitin deacetylase (PgdA/CDA1 family)